MSRPPSVPPTPLASGDAQLFHAALARTRDARLALEELLEGIGRERSGPLMLVLREGRGSWLFDLASEAGTVLFCGNALSGTVIALARAGHQVTIADPAAERLALGLARARQLVRPREDRAGHAAGDPSQLEGVRARPSALPFESASFDVVVGEEDASTPALAEYRRVARKEIALVCDNRLAYKRSAGKRGSYHVPRPLEFLARALRPRDHARTLAGHRRQLAPAESKASSSRWQVVRELALYPHRSEFAQLASLHGGLPKLFVGPRECENRLKLAADALGLFPWLTPSFVLLARKTRRHVPLKGTRIERLLAALAERTGEPPPEIEHAIATRGNALLLQTRPRGWVASDPTRAQAWAQARENPAGWWSVKIPLGLHRERLALRNIEQLASVQRRFPELPLPEALFAGRIAGACVTCERRIPGLSVAQAPDNDSRWERTLRDAVDQLASLVVEPRRELDETSLTVLLDEKFELVVRHVRDEQTRARLAQLHAEVRAELAGQHLPLVAQHADLRPKHVQIDEQGGISGYLDWGSSLQADLPYFDLLHLVCQKKKQVENAPAGRAWGIALDPSTRSVAERDALDAYAQRTGVSVAAGQALERFYPVLVAAQAERTWDYSRPGWVRAHFF